MQTKHLCVWSASELRVRLAPLNQFKPSSKIFYWPFQGGTSFVDLLCFCSVLCLLCLWARLFICALWSPAGKGLTAWLSFVVSNLEFVTFHWYPGSGVVLDCIDSWSLHPHLLSNNTKHLKFWRKKIFYTFFKISHFRDFWNSLVACVKKCCMHFISEIIWTRQPKQNRTWFVHFVMINILLLLRTSGLNIKLKKPYWLYFTLYVQFPN